MVCGTTSRPQVLPAHQQHLKLFLCLCCFVTRDAPEKHVLCLEIQASDLLSDPIQLTCRGGLEAKKGAFCIGHQRDQLRVISSPSCVTKKLQSLDGRHRTIVIAESVSRVFAAIRTTSVRWRSYLPYKHRNRSSLTLRSLHCDSDRAIGVRWWSIRSTWNCGMTCES